MGRWFGTTFPKSILATYSESLKDVHTLDILIALLEICPKEMIGNADLGTTVLFQVTKDSDTTNRNAPKC